MAAGGILIGKENYAFQFFAAVCVGVIFLLRTIKSERIIRSTIILGEVIVSFALIALGFTVIDLFSDNKKSFIDGLFAVFCVAVVGSIIIGVAIDNYKKMNYGLLEVKFKRIALITGTIILCFAILALVAIVSEVNKNKNKEPPVAVPAVQLVDRDEAAILTKIERMKLDASSVVAPYSQELPFLGKRSYNIDGGNGTGETIIIEANGAVKIELHGTQSSSVVYEGLYKNPLPIYSDSALTFKNNKVYRTTPDGKVMMTCGYMGHIDTPCFSNLYSD
jgi:hypothetical protein